MTRIALRSAHPGRLRPSFFFWSLLCAQWALAQPAVYRCGQEYTNAPADAQRCERLALPSVTVIPGTKAQAPLPQAEASATASPGADAAPQKQRDEMARRIVLAELEKARAQHAQLLQAWRQLPAANPPQPQAQALQASIERVARDIDSLQRELARKTP